MGGRLTLRFPGPVKRETVAAVLGETAMFGQLDEASRLAIAPDVVVRTYRKGDPIFSQGDAGESLYIVAAGLVKVFIESEEGSEMVLATLRTPDVFGELAVIDGGPRTASARALERTTLLALTRPTFLHLVQAHPEVADALYRLLGGLIRRTLQQASDLVFLDLPGRVAKLLLALAGDDGKKSLEGAVVDVGVTQGTLAGMVGGSRPSVNQILRAFQDRGVLELRGRMVVIHRPETLRRRAAP